MNIIHKKSHFFHNLFTNFSCNSISSVLQWRHNKKGGLCMKYHKCFAWLTVLFFALTMVTGLKKK